MKKDYIIGVKHGIPIGIGYLAVSFSFGIVAADVLSWLEATVMSMTNITSAGQFAGLTAITAGAGLLEIALIQFVINLRYALMGFSLSQKLPDNITLLQRAVIAFTNTDEIFAVAMSGRHTLTFSYMLGLSTMPFIGWSGGTLLGVLAGNILPGSLVTALGIALYGMLIAVVMPGVRDKSSIRIVVLVALLLSCLFAYVPFINEVSSGISIVICTVVASLVGAVFFPIEEENEQ